MAEDYPRGLVTEALKKGASFFFQKPLEPRNIAFLWQRLWPQILQIRLRMPDATTFPNQKKRVLINSDEDNGRRRKIRNAQGGVTIKGTSHEHDDQTNS